MSKKIKEEFKIEKVDLDFLKKLASLQSLGSDRFRSQTHTSGNPLLLPGNPWHSNVYGGLLFAHSVLAAEMTVGAKFSPHAAHSFFIRTATVEQPVDYVVTRLRDGRSFSTRLVQAIQDGHVVFCSQVSFCTSERSAIEHQTEMPMVSPPEELRSELDLARSIIKNHEDGKIKVSASVLENIKMNLLDDQIALFEFRPVLPNLYLGLEPHSMTTVRYWLRCNVRLGESRDDRSMNRFLLGYITDATMISTANRPHFSHGHKPSFLTTLDHSIHYHAAAENGNFHVDDWLLCENFSPVAGNGRAFTLGRIWTRDGRHLLSCSQESLSRAHPDQPTSKL